MKQSRVELVRAAAGILTFLICVYLVYLSGFKRYSLGTHEFATLLLVATMLLYGPDKAIEIADAIHGNSNASQQSDSDDDKNKDTNKNTD